MPLAAAAPSPPPPDAAALALEQLPRFASADRWVLHFRVASATDARLAYTVAVDAAGRWRCSCPAWVYDPARSPCKHIRELVAGRTEAAA